MITPRKALQELVALPSVNPAFLPEGHCRAGEARVADYLAREGKRAGLDLDWGLVLPGRPNLLLRLRAKGKPRQRVILAPHLDTVSGENEQFTPRVSKGRLYGRGACDTKGSIAAMISALCLVARSKDRPAHTEIIFAGLIDEEYAQAGSRALAASDLKADLAIVGEPTSLRIVTAHKGSVWLRIETAGKAAHGAKPELGNNAVLTAAKAVVTLETRYAAVLRKQRHPLLSHPTVSVGVIEGGTQPNIVPDRCMLELDRRTLPGETDGSVKREVSALLQKQGIRARCIPSKLEPCFPMETDAGLPLVRQFLRAAGQSRPSGVDYFCDASILARSGMPSVVFGPGDISQAHTTNEWIKMAEVENATAILARFLQSLS